MGVHSQIKETRNTLQWERGLGAVTGKESQLLEPRKSAQFVVLSSNPFEGRSRESTECVLWKKSFHLQHYFSLREEGE